MPVKFLISPASPACTGPWGRADAFLERGIDEHLDELARVHKGAHHSPLGAERRNERAQHDESGVRHQLRHLAHAADIFHAIGVGESEIAD